MDTTFQTDSGIFNYRTAAVWIQNGHILLHRQAGDSYWALPGGRVHMGEDSRTSLIREMKEELGVEVLVEQLRWLTENFFDYRDTPFHEIGLYYSVSGTMNSIDWQKGPFHGLEGERLIYQWVPVDELPSMTVYPPFLKEGIGNLPLSIEHIIIYK